jgi:hypothetical protein
VRRRLAVVAPHIPFLQKLPRDGAPSTSSCASENDPDPQEVEQAEHCLNWPHLADPPRQTVRVLVLRGPSAIG